MKGDSIKPFSKNASLWFACRVLCFAQKRTVEGLELCPSCFIGAPGINPDCSVFVLFRIGVDDPLYPAITIAAQHLQLLLRNLAKQVHAIVKGSSLSVNGNLDLFPDRQHQAKVCVENKAWTKNQPVMTIGDPIVL